MDINPLTQFAPITAPYLRDQAFLRLRESIVAGILVPGAPIVIDDLAASFELSAMPVREAVKRLVADGLVEELPRRAHRVAPLTRTSVLNVLEIFGTLMIRAYELRGNVTPYDATYVALAEGLNCPLLTGDVRLKRAAGLRCEVTVFTP